MIMTKPPNHNWNSVFCFLSSSLFSQMASHSTNRRWVGGREGGNVSPWKPAQSHGRNTPPHSSSNNQPAPMQHRIIHTAGRPWQPWRAQGAIRSRVGESRSSGVSAKNRNENPGNRHASRKRDTTRPIQANIKACFHQFARPRSLTVSTGENK
jgi:hypothetical protein